MKLILTAVFIFMCFTSCSVRAQVETVPLWDDRIPNAIDKPDYEETQVFEDSLLSKVMRVSIPSLNIYHPKTPNGTAIVICPGGGYQHLSMYKEGQKVAEWLNDLGITAVVLKYRLPSDSTMTDKRIGPLQDAQEAMRYVRRHAKAWKVNTNKIGVLGFSAGGHLAATLSTQYDRDIYDHDGESARPDFSILVYPVISMQDSITHIGSRRNLLGDNSTKNDLAQYSNEAQITAQTPPAFLAHATNDTSVTDQNSVMYYTSLGAYSVPAELHLYKDGGHGFGMGRIGVHASWPNDCERWLRKQGIIQ